MQLLERVNDETAPAAVLAMESQALAMRGADGDLERAFDLGERALERWVSGTRNLDLRHHLHLHADTSYWVGEYERARELSRQTRALAQDVHSPESLLRGGGFEAVSLAGLGRHEEAIAIWDELFEIARELGQNPRVLLNYSALAYRELYDLDEAQRRSEEALELSESMTFGMPRQFAGSDLLFTHLLADDLGAAQTLWPKLWADASEATAWTTWLIAGRLACAKAKLALRTESIESALEWASHAIEVARRTNRRKYEARSLSLFGQALARAGRREEALASLGRATMIADELIGPPGRWQAQAALGSAAHELGDDDTAEAAYAEAASLVETFVATLRPEPRCRFARRSTGRRDPLAGRASTCRLTSRASSQSAT